MRLILAILMSVTVCVMASMSGTVSSQEPAKRSAELQVLDHFIGDWETEIAVKGTNEKSTSFQSRKWSREGTFVLSEERDLSTKKESHFAITYDSQGKHYRACFINENATVPLLGTWDAQSRTMHWKSSDVSFKHEGANHFIDADHAEWTMTVTSPDGKVVLELSAKQTRRKK